MNSSSVQSAESVIIVGLLVAYLLFWLVRRLSRTRPGMSIGLPVAVAFGLRMAAIAGVSASGLQGALRGGDENTFLDLGHALAAQPIGHGYYPHSPYQLHVVVFALELKLLHMSQGGMRIVQVGFALAGLILIFAAVHDLAGGRSARLAAWVFAFEPASIFFNSALHKEPLMELASGLVVFGATRIWLRLDVRGILLCAAGGWIAVSTRSYAGWFLITAAVLVLLHAAVRSIDRPLRAMPVIYAVAIAAFLATPVLLQASSAKSLKTLQVSQNANAAGIGQGSASTGNSNNLALEQVNFSTRGAIISNLPKRIRDVILEPFPWQVSDNSQRFGAIGTLFAYAVLILLIRYAWICRGEVLPRAAPLLYPMFFLLIAYALSVGNAGTGFRYRTHLITLAIGAMAILRERAMQRLAQRTAAARVAAGLEPAPVREPTPSAV